MTLLTVTATIIDSLGGQASASTSATIDDFVLGATKPDATNVGLQIPIEALIPSNGGPLTIDGSDQLFENIRFNRRVTVTGKRNKFLHCWHAGPANPPAGTPINSLVTCTNSNCQDNQWEFCLFDPQTPQAEFGNSLFGHSFTATRCEFRRNLDAIGIYNGSNTSIVPVNVAILGNLIHRMAYWCPYPSQSDNTSHNDGIQLHYNIDGLAIVGNMLSGAIDPTIGDWAPPTFDSNGNLLSGHADYPATYGTSSIMGTPTGNIRNNITIDQNWIGGGITGINFGGVPSGTNVKVRGNRWARDFRGGQTSYLQKHSSFHFGVNGNESTGNVYEDNGTSANQGACCGTWP